MIEPEHLEPCRCLLHCGWMKEWSSLYTVLILCPRHCARQNDDELDIGLALDKETSERHDTGSKKEYGLESVEQKMMHI